MSVVTVANAQFFRVREAPKHDIAVSMGFGSSLFTQDHFSSCPSIRNSGVAMEVLDSYEWYDDNSINVSYHYSLSDRLGIGLQFGYGEGGWEVVASHYCHSSLANMEYSSFYFMPSGRWFWWNRAHFGGYTRVAAGIGFLWEKENDCNLHDDIDFTCGKRKSAKFAYQLCGLGLEWGGELIRGFAEAGYGVQGYITIGVKATL